MKSVNEKQTCLDQGMAGKHWYDIDIQAINIGLTLFDNLSLFNYCSCIYGKVSYIESFISHTGLNMIYSRPADNFTLDSFFEGTTHPINTTFTASCCVRKAEVIGRDQLGNTGKCEWDLGGFIGKKFNWQPPFFWFDH